MHRLKQVIALTAIVVFPFMVAFGTTIHVPTDQPTIQDGINASSNGDTVLVADGVYSGAGNWNITTYGKSIVVVSANGRTSCILDVQGSGNDGFRLINTGAAPSAEISGFRVISASHGVYLEQSSITVSGMQFDSCGAGVSVTGDSEPGSFGASVSSCEFSYCSTGIYLFTYGDIVVDSCSFDSSGLGMNLAMDYGGTITVKNSVFNGDGTGIDAGSVYWLPQVIVDSCAFSDNGLAAYGGVNMSNSIVDGGTDGIRCNLEYAAEYYSVSNCEFRNLTGTVFTGADQATISGCLVENNPGTILYGRSIEETYIHMSIANSQFLNNGGGISVGHVDTYFSMSNCSYIANGAGISYGGTFRGSFAVSNCEFVDIDANVLSIDCYESPASITGCFFKNNLNNIMIGQMDQPCTIASCTFVEGNALGMQVLYGTGSVTFEHNLMYQNAGPLLDIGGSYSGAVTVECNDFYGYGIGFQGLASPIGSNNNFSSDPQFCDEITYALFDISPCSPDSSGCGQLIGWQPVSCIFYDGPIWWVDANSTDTIANGSVEYPFLEIEDALDASSPGDTIRVRPGLYYPKPTQNTFFVTDRILESSNGANSTILRDNGAGENSRAAQLQNAELIGFTVSGCDNDGHVSGIRTYGNSKIIDCVVDSNQCYEGPVGIWNYGHLEVIRSTISRNMSYNDQLEGGTGLYSEGSYILLDSCLVRGNAHASRNARGNGACLLSDTVVVQNCIFEGNYTSRSGDASVDGIGLYVDGDSVLITNNIFRGNFADYDGEYPFYFDVRGVGLSVGSPGVVTHNLFSDNHVVASLGDFDTHFGLRGIGLFCDSSTTVHDNVIVNNKATVDFTVGIPEDYTDMTIAGAGYFGPDSNLAYNLLWNNFPEDASVPNWQSLTGMIWADPRYSDTTSGQAILAANSPCVGAASDGGDIGPLAGNYGPPINLTIFVDAAFSDSSQNGRVMHPFGAIQPGIDAAVNGDTVLILAGTYSGQGNHDVATRGKALLISSNEDATSTVIDCSDTLGGPHDGFILTSGEDTSLVIQGFKITNAEHAILGDVGGCKLVNCILSANQYAILTEDSPELIIVGTRISESAITGLHVYGAGLLRVEGSDIVENAITGIEMGYCGESSFDSCRFDSNGRAISATNAGEVDIRSCDFTSNSMSGFHSIGYLTLSMLNSRFSDNSGSSVYIDSDDATVSASFLGSTFSRNVAQLGAGIRLHTDRLSIFVDGCSFIGNAADSGAAIYSTYMQLGGIELDIRNSIIAYNEGLHPIASTAYEYGTVSMICSDLYGNSGGNWLGIAADFVDSTGNIEIDPLFCDTANNDFSVANISPCAAANNTCNDLIGALDIGCTAFSGTARYVAPWGEDILTNGSESSPYQTLAYAISACADGDSLLLHPGIYQGPGNRDLSFGTKNLVMKGLDDSVANTVINFRTTADAQHWVVALDSAQDSSTIIEGILITDSDNVGYSYYPAIIMSGSSAVLANCKFLDLATYGAIRIDGGAPRIQNCEFERCWAGNFGLKSNEGSEIEEVSTNLLKGGGAIGMEGGATPTIENCVFTFNEAAFREGGAIACVASLPTIVDCQFYQNECYSEEGNTFGGADIIFRDSSDAVVKGCLFSGGMADYTRGGAIACINSSPTVDSCSFVSGYATDGGGAVWCADSSSPVFSYCVFENGYVTYGLVGGAILAESESQPQFINCTARGNSTGEFGITEGQAVFSRTGAQPIFQNCLIAFNGETGAPVAAADSSSIPLLYCTDIYNPSGISWVGLIAGQASTNNNFSIDPDFCNGSEIALTSFCAPAHSPCGELVGARMPTCTAPCCRERTGNANYDLGDIVNLSDLTKMVNYLFVTFEPLPCRAEANVNGDAGCAINLSDVTTLVNFLFVTFVPPAECTSFNEAACGQL